MREKDYGIIMICTFFMCLFFNPTSELPVVSFFGRIIVFTLLGMATMLVYYSKEELTQRAWWGRTILHLVILEALYLPLAHHWGFWYEKIHRICFRYSEGEYPVCLWNSRLKYKGLS